MEWTISFKKNAALFREWLRKVLSAFLAAKGMGFCQIPNKVFLTRKEPLSMTIKLLKSKLRFSDQS